MAGKGVSPESYDLKIPAGRRVPPGLRRGAREGGTPAADSDAAELGLFADVVSTRLVDEVAVDGARAGREGEAAELAGIPPDTVLELELQGGMPWWTTAADLAEMLAEADVAPDRGGAPPQADGSLVIPAALPFGGQERGLGGLLLRVLRRFDVDLASGAAGKVVERLENKLQPGPGLYPCPSPKELKTAVTSPADLPGGGPLLVLLHGTASSTAGSFGGLVEKERLPQWQRLQGGDHFAGRIFAFEHRTLSQSPAENALELARLLPQGAEVHLVSHSRGGLVGELLCRGGFVAGRPAFSDAEIDMFDAATHRRDREALAELRQVLAEKRLTVPRFVRVACPARGTLLASKKLDRYLSLMLNALGLALGGKLNPTYQFVKALTISLVKKRSDPAEIPGLEAQMPRSPLVKMLNIRRQAGDSDPTVTDADLTVIAGDIEGSGFFGHAKVFAADLFFGRDHDLVVDSRAMFGGAPRTPGGARYYFEKGTATSHFNYFSNLSSAVALVTALTHRGDEVPGFEELRVGTAPAGVRAIEEPGVVLPEHLDRLAPDRPVAVLLPGIMGSRLKAGDNVIWIDLSDLLQGRFEELAIRDDDRVGTAGLVERSYRDLAAFLGGSHEVVPVAYDWRREIDGAADALADLLRDLLDRTEQPVRLLAHSMGGLVARRLRALHRDVWDRLREREGFRFVMLGTPNGGSHAIVGILLFKEGILRMLDLVDGDAPELVRQFPGILDMMPPRSNALSGDPGADLFDVETWRRWRRMDPKVLVPPEALLAGAKAFREAVDGDRLAGDEVLYVAGHAPEGTPFAVSEVRDGKGRRELRLVLSPKGDGRVLWDTGIPDGVEEAGRLWYAPGVSHGALASEKSLFPALRELLESGRTARLSRERPSSRGGIERQVFAVERPLILPDEADLEAAALGAPRKLALADGTSLRLRVSVSYGSLAFARGPVLVGHYERDVIASAESFLDHILDGALRQRHALGLYPGAEGTGDVILDADDPTRGGLVAGLGAVGDLSPGNIRRGVRQAVMRYATVVAKMDHWPDVDEAGRRRLTVSSLLVGTGVGTGISVDDSVQAVIQGVGDAWRILEDVLDEAPRIRELEFVELYEHRAVCAAEALTRLSHQPLSRQRIELDLVPRVRPIEGGQRDIPCSSRGWFRRLQIVEDQRRFESEGGDGPGAGRALLFTSLTERARAEARMLQTQRRLVERYVERSISETAWRPELAKTLFELLVPTKMKGYAPDERDLLLIVDKVAAGFPWELISDGLEGREPLSVRAGMLRQLATSTFREGPLTPTERSALVIGDPRVDDRRFPPLPAARREAETVASLLGKRRWRVEPVIGSAPDEVITALLGQPYKLIHIAAHGVYDPDRPLASGVVLGDDILITPAELEQLPAVPELAFVNCCHLGRIEGDDTPPPAWNRLAANFGLKLIELGVRAVVVAGWAVNDAAADKFATVFYGELFRGETFLTAVKRARRDTYRLYPETNTWGAYQCYGDPSYRLVKGRDTAEDQEWVWVSPLRVVHELENLRSRARTGSRWEKMCDEVGHVETTLMESYPEWLHLGEVREALGRAWAELVDLSAWRVTHAQLAEREPGEGVARKLAEERLAFSRSLENLKASLTCVEGGVSFDAQGEVRNLEVRGGTVAWRLERRLLENRIRKAPFELENAPEAEVEALEEALENELADLQLVTEKILGDLLADQRRSALLAPNPRRWTWVGSAAKRLAAVYGADRLEALEVAIQAYRNAMDQSLAATGEVTSYPAGNWCLLQVVTKLADGNRPLGDVEATLAELAEERPVERYWDTVDRAQVRLVQELLRIYRGEPGDSATVVEAWRQTERRSRSRLQITTLTESLDTLVDLLDDRWGADDPGMTGAGARRMARARRMVLALRGELLAELEGSA